MSDEGTQQPLRLLGQPMGPDGGSPDVIRSVLRAVQVLESFTDERPAWSVTELALSLDLPKTTVVRLLSTLKHAGLLWTRPDGLITISARMLVWIHSADRAWRLPESVLNVMASLANRYGEAVNFYIRQDNARISIGQCEGTHNLRHIIRVGDRLPLWGGASAIVLLHDAPSSLLSDVASHAPYSLSADILAARVKDAWARGYAVSHGEREVGASGVAVPILGRRERLVGALAFGGPTGRFTDERTKEFAHALRAAAAEIGCLGIEDFLPLSK